MYMMSEVRGSHGRSPTLKAMPSATAKVNDEMLRLPENAVHNIKIQILWFRKQTTVENVIMVIKIKVELGSKHDSRWTAIVKGRPGTV